MTTTFTHIVFCLSRSRNLPSRELAAICHAGRQDAPKAFFQFTLSQYTPRR
jgi:hypothetical protein